MKTPTYPWHQLQTLNHLSLKRNPFHSRSTFYILLDLDLERNSLAAWQPTFPQPHILHLTRFSTNFSPKAQQLGKLPCNASLRGQRWCWNLIQVWWTLTCPQLMAVNDEGWDESGGSKIMRTPTPKLHALIEGTCCQNDQQTFCIKFDPTKMGGN